ncbi:hypothetical protein DYQ86_15865 [Acidobacteria bacterium AB60]|nr:hypothetical protein DYQ86_15865 [Acidobacteria bacterium AB60]
MPHLTAIDWAIWLLVIVAQLAFVGLSLRMKRAWREWPAVFSFVAFKAFVSLALVSIMLSDPGTGDLYPAIYFYTYWISSALAAILEVWIVTEIGCRVAPPAGRVLDKAIPTLAAIFLIGSLFVSDSSPVTFTLELTRLVVSLDRAAALAWLASFVSLWYASEFLGIRWDRVQIGVAIGFTVHSIGDTAVAWLLGTLPRKWDVLSNAQSFFWIGAMVAWSLTFLRLESPPAPPLDLQRLGDSAKTYIDALKTLRTKR